MKFRHVIATHSCYRFTGKFPTLNCFPVDQKNPLVWLMWSPLLPVPPLGKNGQQPSKPWLKACRSKRRRWWTPLQTPWTWRSAWPKSDTKWYEPFAFCFRLVLHHWLADKAPHHRAQTSALFLCTLTLSWSSHRSRAARFALRTLPSSLSTFPTSAVGGLAQDSISGRFQHSHMSCHKGLRP